LDFNCDDLEVDMTV